KGEMKETPVAVPAGTAFDSKSPNFEADVRKFLQAQNLPSDFDYIRARGDSFTTRPSSQPHFTFEQKDGTVTAKRIDPSFLASLLEIHKGHGPEIYRLFGALAGLMLFIVVMGGLTIGLISAAYRKQTLISLAAGSTIFAYIAFFA
ncbi:MAG: hypothetical protein KAZ17_01490, partial [Sphingorhabdus sp.]|nr:hypothetical protein [Sphingorhabdus sp.]